MTKREAAIVSAYTGILIGDFGEFFKYVNEIMDKPIFVHELSNDTMAYKIKLRSEKDFMNIKVE